MTIGIIGALNEEIQLFLHGMDHHEKRILAGITFYKGKFNNQDVVVCKSGVGKVNASVCTQILINMFEVTSVIFTGVAGAINPDLEIGDIVISKDCIQHDMDATALGFKLGEIPYEEVYIFEADPSLVNLAKQVSLEEVGNQQTVIGRVLSGDQFIANNEKVKQLYKEFKGACTEMEGSAVAQVCHMNKVPFVIIRSMSDKANGHADVNFVEFVRVASEHSYKILNGLLKKWK